MLLVACSTVMDSVPEIRSAGAVEIHENLIYQPTAHGVRILQLIVNYRIILVSIINNYTNRGRLHLCVFI